MRGALTTNKSDTDKPKPTNLKLVLTISNHCCLVCVFRLLTWLILHLPLQVCGGHAMDVLLPRHPRPRQRESRRSQRFQQINAF